jgi:hypothetical protein
MARFDLSDHDHYRIRVAREELARAKRLDLADDRAMARAIGRLEVALGQLLEVFDEDDQQ